MVETGIDAISQGRGCGVAARLQAHARNWSNAYQILRRLHAYELTPQIGIDHDDVARLALTVVLLEGSATDLMERQFREAGARIEGRYGDLRSAVEAALRAAPPGGAVLLSPGTASFGMFLNEFDRGDKFRAIVTALEEQEEA